MHVATGKPQTPLDGRLLLAGIRASGRLLTMTSLFFPGSGMISTCAGRCRPKSDFLSIRPNYYRFPSVTKVSPSAAQKGGAAGPAISGSRSRWPRSSGRQSLACRIPPHAILSPRTLNPLTFNLQSKNLLITPVHPVLSSVSSRHPPCLTHINQEAYRTHETRQDMTADQRQPKSY